MVAIGDLQYQNNQSSMMMGGREREEERKKEREIDKKVTPGKERSESGHLRFFFIKMSSLELR
jgi:hypothetical protein